MKQTVSQVLFFIKIVLPYSICLIFFIAYSTLSIVRHNSYQSFGYDLGINDHITWEYSQFHAPTTTIDHVPFTSKLDVHVEIIYILLAPFYWIWSDARILLLLQAFIVCFSSIAIYLLAKTYKLPEWSSLALLLVYLLFYGVQNALWFDVHSAPFGAAFLGWFIYFLVKKDKTWSIVFFLLAITAKENIAGITFLVSLIYFIATRQKSALYFAGASLLYLAFVFGVYFPQFVDGGYRFANEEGLFSRLDPSLMYDTADKQKVYFYSFLSFGFLPFLSPLYLIPVLGNLASYFILGSNVSTAQGLFLQYRIGLTPLLAWGTIVSMSRYKILQTKYVGLYLVLCAFLVQYMLHLPLSYLAKSWFWESPSEVADINKVITFIPKNAAVVSQNNITPHVSQRYYIFTLYPEKKSFQANSPCDDMSCDWFRWSGNPEYLIANPSSIWDTRHLLTDPDSFQKGLVNMEQAGVIKKYKQVNSAVLYEVLKNPN